MKYCNGLAGRLIVMGQFALHMSTTSKLSTSSLFMVRHGVQILLFAWPGAIFYRQGRSSSSLTILLLVLLHPYYLHNMFAMSAVSLTVSLVPQPGILF